VRPLGGKRRRWRLHARVVLVRGIGRAMARQLRPDSKMLHPKRRRRNTHPGLSFASYDPYSGQWLPELSRKGTRASELRSAASNPHAGVATSHRAVAGDAATLCGPFACTQLLQHAHAISLIASSGSVQYPAAAFDPTTRLFSKSTGNLCTHVQSSPWKSLFTPQPLSSTCWR
jgi:hypothetical protein